LNILSIDVGLTGAICFFNGKEFEVNKMPLVKVEDSSYSRWYNTVEILKIFDKYNKVKDIKVLLEYQRPMSKQGVVSVFRLGRGFGLLEGILRAIFDNVILIDPKTWQNFIHKKFLSKEEIRLFKEFKYEELSKNLESLYKELFIKKYNTKSLKQTKIKSFYSLCKSKYIEILPKDLLKDHDKIDSVLLSIYGYLSL